MILHEQENISHNLMSFITSEHIGICLFTHKKFLENSSLAFAFQFLLNWNKDFIQCMQNDLEQSLFISQLYDRSFPVLITQRQLTHNNFEEHLRKFSELIAGLCVKDGHFSDVLTKPKLLLLFDQSSLDSKLEKMIRSFSLKLKPAIFQNSHPLSVDIYP